MGKAMGHQDPPGRPPRKGRKRASNYITGDGRSGTTKPGYFTGNP